MIERGFGLYPLKEEGTIDAHGKTYRPGDPGYDELSAKVDAEIDARVKVRLDELAAKGEADKW